MSFRRGDRPSLASRILAELAASPGLTDRELTTRLYSSATHPSAVNQECRLLERRHELRREVHKDGIIRNYPSTATAAIAPARKVEEPRPISSDAMSEDDVKRGLKAWLEADGWSVEVAWGRSRGIDIRAVRGSEIWIIEAKGCGSLQPMRVNYFVGALGELLQRMDVDGARYSLAFPDMNQFRGLWDRLPKLAKGRTGITTLFVRHDGVVEEVK